MDQLAQAERRLATDWAAGSILGVRGVDIFLHSFVSRLVLKSIQSPINEYRDRLFGIVISMSDCHPKGPGFDPQLCPTAFSGNMGS